MQDCYSVIGTPRIQPLVVLPQNCYWGGNHARDKPSVEQRVQSRQERQQLDHDQHARSRVFKCGDLVFVENHRRGGDKWLAGKIVEVTGPVSFRVQLADGSVSRCHQDQLRTRVNQSAAASASTESAESGSDDFPEVTTPPSFIPPTKIAQQSESESTPDTATASTVESTVTTERRYPARDRQPPDYFRN